ncbi:FAD/NAD(P)-binding domain-containing protein [Aspergillus steynii IBT 23096]|uniref:FAD/NAD(P)-binding domain-containing protein n=1 Tax=Aspergillus steynii IBT 23096 TaxID=1392250 RepID=A0A2I2GFH4_9EURO|nr:FAD/NAD(P)-binding domain-containing protein [Aspergillus steynii IBT 23096]PLB51633.1 FAD/NAD(P)-binding domain-containing protein [Aspergillus steynii IBT 23096]
MATPEDTLSIAIIGSGIIGTVLALGLLNHPSASSDTSPKPKLKVKVYEQASSIREIGAGIAFTANARKCMSMIDARLPECVRSVATANGDPANPTNYMQFVDGYTHAAGDGVGEEMEGRTVHRLHAGERGFEGCHRAQFLEKVMELMPGGVVELRKRLVSLDQEDGDKVKMRFEDGSQEVADAVIGCDGIKSLVRQHLLGPSSPSSYPHYTHKIAYRGLVPMPLAMQTLGPYRATNQHMYGGPSAHLLHFPVMQQKLMNVVAFVSDASDWPLDKAMSQPATREEAAVAFKDWGPTVKAIINLLPDEMDKWAVFDHLEFPTEKYSEGRVCLAGDAAHASSPHHGAGAGIGIEDALALRTLVGFVLDDLKEGGGGEGKKKDLLTKAFQTFSKVRHERSMWLVQSSREACEIYEWNHPEFGSDMGAAHEDIRRRTHKIWYFDIEGMMGELEGGYRS